MSDIERNARVMPPEEFADAEHTGNDSTEGGHGRIDCRRGWAIGETGWPEQRLE